MMCRRSANSEDRGAQAHRGLTLVEVILAISILSLSLTVLLTGVARCLAVVKSAKNYQTAQWILGRGEAEHAFFRPENIQEWDVMALEVEPETYPDGFVFSRHVEEDDDEDDLYVVRTRVSWEGRSGVQAFEEVVHYVWHPSEDEEETGQGEPKQEAGPAESGQDVGGGESAEAKAEPRAESRREARAQPVAGEQAR